MTTHYIIETPDKKTKVKVTYLNGDFKKFERLKTKDLDMDYLIDIFEHIPMFEFRFYNALSEGFISNDRNYNIYKQADKPKSYYQTYVSIWYDFYQNKFSGVKPKFTKADGQNLKQIIKYLNEISNDEDQALTVWQTILSNWKSLDSFHQRNTDIKYINSQLNKIINNVKRINQKSTGVSGDYAQKVRDDLRS